MSSIYDFSAKSLRGGKEINLSDYKGKVIMVVNTASKCGLTPQYEGLQKLHEAYSDKGLVILGFPCNQFAGQEPGGAKEIEEGCLINYGVDFQMFEKVDVNGDSAHPIFKYLRKELPGFLVSSIKWNFTKFLIDADGKPYKRYSPTTTPESMIRDIERLLAKSSVAN